MSRTFTSTMFSLQWHAVARPEWPRSSKVVFQWRAFACYEATPSFFCSIAYFCMSSAAISSTELFFNGVSVHGKCHCTSRAATSSTELFLKGMPLHVKDGHFEHAVLFQLFARAISRMGLTFFLCWSICKSTRYHA